MKKIQFALCSTLLVFSQAALADTHCNNTEKIVFSCSFGKKMVSICASSDLSASAGYMQYRFGAKDKVELQYPQSQVHPRGKFDVKRQTPVLDNGTRAKLTEVSFTQGDIKYIVDSMDTGSTDKTTLDVERNGKQLASLVCNNASIVNKDFSYYEILDSFVDANNAPPVKQADAQSSPPMQAAPQRQSPTSKTIDWVNGRKFNDISFEEVLRHADKDASKPIIYNDNGISKNACMHGARFYYTMYMMKEKGDKFAIELMKNSPSKEDFINGKVKEMLFTDRIGVNDYRWIMQGNVEDFYAAKLANNMTGWLSANQTVLKTCMAGIKNG